jgi:hypothetical protein
MGPGKISLSGVVDYEQVVDVKAEGCGKGRE